MARPLSGTLRQLPSGRWEASVPLHTGSTHRVYATFDTRVAADAWRAAQLLVVTDGGTATKPDGPTTPLGGVTGATAPGRIAALLVEDLHARGRPGPGRRRDIDADLRNHVLPYLDHVGVTRIDQFSVWHLTHDLPLWLAGKGRYRDRTGHTITTSRGTRRRAGDPVGIGTARNVLQAARRLALFAVALQALDMAVPSSRTRHLRRRPPEDRPRGRSEWSSALVRSASCRFGRTTIFGRAAYATSVSWLSSCGRVPMTSPRCGPTRQSRWRV